MELIDKIEEFVNSMKGKRMMTHDEQEVMFGLYNKYYNTVEQNYGCDLCAIRIFSKLENLIKKKNGREQT
jgi:hypothetical protein